MRHDFLDRYSRLASPVHRLPAAAKLAGVLAIVCVTIFSSSSTVALYIVEAAGLVAIALVSRIPLLFFVKRMLALEPIVIGASVLNLIRPDGAQVFGTIVLKSNICLLAMILLANTTTFAAVLNVLKRIHFPAILVTVLALMYRYVFVLIDESERMSRARMSRSLKGGRIQTWKNLGTLAGQLFIRSSERAERIYAAMCARGWK